MPIYPYECTCGTEFDVTARMSELDFLIVNCPECAKILDKSFRNVAIVNFANEKVEDTTFCPALGCLVKGNKDRERIAKSRGLEPLGNEPIDKVNSFFKEKQDQIEKKNDAELRHEVMSALQ